MSLLNAYERFSFTLPALTGTGWYGLVEGQKGHYMDSVNGPYIRHLDCQIAPLVG